MMFDFCEIALLVGLSAFGCEPSAPAQVDELPQQDPKIFDYEIPPPPPPPPPKVIMPPVVVEKVVEKPVLKPSPPAKTVVKTHYVGVVKEVKAPEVVGPDPHALQLQQAYLQRYGYETQITDRGSLQAYENNTARQIGSLKSPDDPDRLKIATDNYEAPGRTSTGFVDNTRILAADRYLTGVMESGVNSQLANEGTVVIQISRDVFGAHNRFIVVPKGSRMICEYKSAEKAGQTRIGFDCKRILLGESRAEIYQLKSQVADVQGYNGLSGEVDNRWWEKYGTAVISTGISAAFQASTVVAGQLEQEGQTTASDSVASIGENFNTLTTQFLSDNVELRPIIRIAQGTRVLIKLTNDWYLKPV